MAEPQDAKPEDTVQQAAAAGPGPEGDARGAEASFHDLSSDTAAPSEGLGRKDPITTGQNARNDHGVQTR